MSFQPPAVSLGHLGWPPCWNTWSLVGPKGNFWCSVWGYQTNVCVRSAVGADFETRKNVHWLLFFFSLAENLFLGSTGCKWQICWMCMFFHHAYTDSVSERFDQCSCSLSFMVFVKFPFLNSSHLPMYLTQCLSLEDHTREILMSALLCFCPHSSKMIDTFIYLQVWWFSLLTPRLKSRSGLWPMAISGALQLESMSG